MSLKKTKGKQKSLPKLKAILANPNTIKCPVLDEKELNQLKLLLQNAIQDSKLEPRVFATEKGICLGLESSLRIINSNRSSCVFISLSIKPNYVVGLVARNAETKDETQPVYAQPNLENLIQDIFGIHALCMVFPLDLMAISDNINKWVQERKKPTKIKHVPEVGKKTISRKTKLPKMQTPDTVEESTTTTESVAKEWSGDFISLGNGNYEIDKSKFNGHGAVNALMEIFDKIPTSSKVPIIIEKRSSKSDENLQTINENSSIKNDDTDSDDFLGQYKNLIVHKIKGNPNKKPKKKRKKNKKNSAK